jgi:cytochrome c peroxidase
MRSKIFALLLTFLLGSAAQAVEKKEIDAIFKAKCMDCHSNETVMPWYATLPIVKDIIGADIEKGRSYFMLPSEFFAYQDLQSIPKHVVKRLQNEVRHDAMPPILYKFGHFDKIVSADEKKKILEFLGNVNQNLVEPLPRKESLKLNQAKVSLGNELYHDKRLSGDNTLSCASCHDLAKGGTDQAVSSTGIRGQIGPINSPTTYNSVYNIKQFWDGRSETLETQAHGPVNNPGEMGSNWDEVIVKLKKDPILLNKFNSVYGTKNITGDMIANSIAEFEKSLITPNSRFDKYLRGDKKAITPDEKTGYELFQKHNCTSCHFGPALGGGVFRKMGVANDYFADRVQGRNGLTKRALSEADLGLYNFTKKDLEKNNFKVPILRNIELTYPYMHDGSIPSLEKAVEVMSFYQFGTKINNHDRDLIVKFLKTLTDEDLK